MPAPFGMQETTWRVLLALPFMIVSAVWISGRPIFSLGKLGADIAHAPDGSRFVSLAHGRTRYIYHPAAAGDRGGDGAAQGHADLASDGCLVLIHGFSGTADVMDPIARMVNAETGICTLTYDLYGRGFSEDPATKHDAGLFVGQLAELLAALQIPRPVSVLGLSMGGAIAASFASVYPDSVERLILVSAAGIQANRPIVSRLAGLPILGEAVCSLLAPSMLVSQLDKEWMPPLNSDYDEAKAQVVRHVEYNPGLPRALLSTLRYFPLASMQPTYESLRDHDRPVLLLWGDSDETTPYSAAQQLVRMLPRARLETLRNAKHLALLQRKAQSSAAISEFLRETAKAPRSSPGN